MATELRLDPHGRSFARSLYAGQIADMLRERLIDGAIPAGRPLAEARFAEELAVSRGPVRNALQVLEGEGLVTSLPNGRRVSAGFGIEDAEGLFDARFVLEQAAVERAIAADADPAPLLAAFEELAAGGSHARLVDLDIAFHLALLNLSGSRFLVNAWLSSASVIQACVTITTRQLAAEDPESNFSRIVASHRDLLDAFLAHDGDLVAGHLREHFTFSASLFAARREAQEADGRRR